MTDAPVIVSGRVESWHESDIPALGSFTTIIARVRVDRVFKGAAPDTLQVVDLASLSKSPPGWFGASGACGNFDEDPVGKYLIIGLEPYEADGTLVRSNRIWLLYIGDEMEGEWYERAQARLAPLGPPSPPSAGNSAGSAPGIAPALGVALLACSAILAPSPSLEGAKLHQ